MNAMLHAVQQVSKRILKQSRVLAGIFLIPLAFFAPVVSAEASTLANLPDLIDRIKPSIVVIGTYSQTRSPAFVMRGTGFVIADGTLIATNAHVVPEILNSASGETLVIQAFTASKIAQQRAAKVAVADKNSCFITSANLTGYAMEKNMEAGVLISGGRIPRLLDDHLRSLVDTKLVSPV